MTSGDVYVSDLHRSIKVPPNEHFSCRTYVHENYRGRDLMSHMLSAYSRQIPPNDIIWGPILRRNTASIRSVEKIGWRHTGDNWTRFVLGHKLPGERHFPPRESGDQN